MTSKETILSEIRRIANEIGRAPGKEYFQRQTAIPESQWYGRYWLSWHDAVSEAGLQPNSVPKKISKDELLRLIAEATRHLRHFPTKAELRLYRRKHPRFPADSTIMKTFSDKDDLLRALHDWVLANDEFSDVKPTLSPLPDALPANETAIDGYVYLLKSGGHYKIGRSDNLVQRVKQISVTLPEDVTVVHYIRTDDAVGIEAYWHRRFSERRANGEWFELSSSDVKAFKKRKYQ